MSESRSKEGKAALLDWSPAGRLLLIEDNSESRALLTKLLRMSSYEVESVDGGEAGLAAAVAMQPELIITDIHMPGMDGIEFIRRVRLDGRIGTIPVIVVTAFGSGTAREAIEAGANACIEKPFDFEKFLEVLQSLIAESRRAKES